MMLSILNGQLSRLSVSLQSVNMAEPNNSSIDIDTAPDTISDQTIPDDTTSQSQLLSSSVTENQPAPTIAPLRNWILYLPAETREIVFQYLLQLPQPVPYHLRSLWSRRDVQAHTGILRTSRLIHREGINIFYRVNTFSVPILPTFTMVPSRRIGDTMQNLSVNISLLSRLQGTREQFIALIHTFGDPAILRGTFSICIFLPPRYRLQPCPLQLFLRGLGRFTNFRVVTVNVAHARVPVLLTSRCFGIESHYQRIENFLRPVLGPPEPRAIRQALTFLPQSFLNAQRSREDWMDYLDGIRLDWNGDEANADQNADQSIPPV